MSPRHCIALAGSLALLTASPAYARSARHAAPSRFSAHYQGVQRAVTIPAGYDLNASNLGPGSSDPAMRARIFVGPGWELGTAGQFGLQTSETDSTSTNPGTAEVDTASATTSLTPTNMGNGVGVLYGADFTDWSNPQVGVGVSLFGSYLGLPGVSASVLDLDGQPTTSYKNTSTTSGGATSTTAIKTSFAFSPAAGPNYGVTITGPGALGTSSKYTTDYSITSGPKAGLLFELADGESDTTANTPHDNFSSSGGMQFSTAQTTVVNDVGVNGDYLLWKGSRGNIGLIGGVTVPIMGFHSVGTASTLGANKQPGAAVVTDLTVDATGTQTAKVVKAYTLNNTDTTDQLVLGVGPVVGVSAAYDLTSWLHLSAQLGYSPVMTATDWINSVSNDSTEELDTTSTTAASTPTTKDTKTTSLTPTANVVGMSGTEAMASAGADMTLGPVQVYGQLLARSYELTPAGGGAVLPYGMVGARVGAGLAF